MDATKRHLIQDAQNNYSIIEAGEAVPEGCTLLGPVSRNVDGSFEDGLSSVESEGNKIYYHSLAEHRARRLAVMRQARNEQLNINDKKFLIALKKEDTVEMADLRTEAQALRDLPPVMEVELEALTDIESIDSYRWNNQNLGFEG